MASRSAAQVIVGGKTSNYSGRMPGTLEECVLALALKRPVYLVGACGGRAAVIGELLGLGEAPEADRTALRPAESGAAAIQKDALFRASGAPGLPDNLESAVAFVASHTVAGTNWPDNGLTVRENRDLFAARDNQRIAYLIREGLVRRMRGRLR